MADDDGDNGDNGTGETILVGIVDGVPGVLFPVALLPRRKFPLLSMNDGAEADAARLLLPVDCFFGYSSEEAKDPKFLSISILLGMCKIFNMF